MFTYGGNEWENLVVYIPQAEPAPPAKENNPFADFDKEFAPKPESITAKKGLYDDLLAELKPKPERSIIDKIVNAIKEIFQ